MIILLNILILLLLSMGVLYWKQQQAWLKQSQSQAQLLAKNESLLRQLTQEQDRWLEKTSTLLHSNLKSKIHAIDLALYRIKKQIPNSKWQHNFNAISTATASSLQVIEDLGQSVIAPTLYTLGFLPALHELATRFDATIHISVQPAAAQLEPNASARTALYALIKTWLEQSIQEHQANEVFLSWELKDDHWQLLYKDNGQYFSTNKEVSLSLLQRLSTLSAKIEHQESSMSGRTIILAA